MLRVRLIGILTLCTTLQGVLWAQETDLRQVLALQKPVSLRLVMRPLREAIEQIASQTGVPLGVAKSIEQYKTTLVVRERPAWQTLLLLAQVYGFEWRAEESGRYYLVESASSRIQLQRQQQAEIQALQRNLEDRLQSYQRASQIDFIELRQRLEAIDSERVQLEERRPPDWIDRAAQLALERAQLSPAGESLLCYLLGRISREWWQEHKLRLWNGQPLLASTIPIAGAQSLPEATLRWLTAWTPAFAEESPQSALMVIRFDSLRRVLSLALVVRRGEQTLTFTEDLPIVVPTVSKLSHKLLPETIMNLPLRRAPNESALTSPYWGKQSTLAELLVWLSDRTDLNIVADAFRVPASTVELENTARTVGDWIQNVLRTNAVEIETPEAGWLLVRHQDQAELIAGEIDEPTLARFEARAATGLKLDDYAELAYLLTPSQQRRLERPNGYALRFDPTPFQNNIPALRFWASLLPAQRQAARERQPLSYPQLSTIQQRLFWEAIECSLLNPVIPSGDLLSQLDRLYDPQSHNDLAFFLDYWKDAAFEIRDGSVTLTFEDVESYEQTLKSLREQGASVSILQQARLNFYLYFGYETRSAAKYTVSLNELPQPSKVSTP